MKKLTIFVMIALIALLASCAQPTPETIIETIIETVTVIETQVIEKEGETIIETVEVIKEVEVQIEVTPTPVPVEKEEAEAVLGVLPRSETLIVGQLTGRTGSPSNFNSWVGWKWRDRGTQQLANEPLWTVDFASGEIINGSADGDAIYNEDFTEVTFPLRQGVTWSDGEPFTSADVVFTIETLMSQEGFNDYNFFVDNVASVTAVDDHTVFFELTQPNSRFHQKFLDRWGCTWIMPKHIWETVEDPLTYEANPFIGTGPYTLHSYDEAGYWTIWEKRADWDKSPTGILYGEPKPQYVVFQSFANEGAKILAQLTHELDAVDLSSEGLKAALTQGDSNRAYQPTYPWVVNNDPCLTGITFNTFVEPFDNVDVRWALILAIDIAEHVGQAVDGTGTLSAIHVPALGSYPEYYHVPMEEWLSEFELDLGDGEMFKPYDTDAPQRIVEYAQGRGYVFDTSAEYVDKAFGTGWFKYAPEEAEKLLIKNGFSKDEEGMWLLPDGTPWEIEILSQTDTSHLQFKNAAAVAQQWKQFGIDATHITSDAQATLVGTGDFMVSGDWPAESPWGAGTDLFRVLDAYNSIYVEPIGELTKGRESRWSSPELDAIIADLRDTDLANTDEVVALGTEGLKVVFTEMPGIPIFGYIGFVSWDETYWANWPGTDNPYTQPYVHWGPFKYMTPFLEPTGY